MRGLNECLSVFSALLSGWDKIQCRCCPSNYLTDLEFYETRHMIGRDFLWVYMNIRLRIYQNQYDILYVKKINLVNSVYD
jgi:hypothetical protein